VTTEEFERLNEHQAELWIAARYRRFVDSGFPPDLSLIFAVHPDVAVPPLAALAVTRPTRPKKIAQAAVPSNRSSIWPAESETQGSQSLGISYE
jgi:hypothetical protein